MAIVFVEIDDSHHICKALDDKGKHIFIQGYYNSEDGWVASNTPDKIILTNKRRGVMQIFDENGHLLNTKQL